MRLPYLPLLFCAGLGALSSVANAQLGVAPSQTSQFLEELKRRQGETGKDPLGDDRAALERSRNLGRPDILSASQADAVRLQSDLTDYAGHYQAGRRYLTPFSQGVAGPALSQKTGGLAWGMALEQSIEYNRYEFEQLRGPVFLVDPKRQSWLGRSYLYVDGQAGSLAEGRLTFGIGLGAAYGLTDELMLENGAGWAGEVLPGSSIAYDVQLGPVLVTIYDRVSVRPSIRIGGPLLDAWGSFGVTQNDAGLAGAWRIDEKWSAVLNYNWALSHASDDIFGALGNRTVHSVSGQLDYAGGQSWSAGLEGGFAWSDREQLHTDGREWHAGVFLRRRLRNSHEVRLAAGYQGMEFRDAPLLFLGVPPFFAFLTTGDYSDVEEPYYQVTLSGRLHERVSHELVFGCESTLGSVANAVSAHYANYGVTLTPWKRGRISVSGYLELAEDSGGVLAGRHTGRGGDIAIEQELGTKWRVGVAYHYGCYDLTGTSLGLLPTGYEQHGFGLTLAYQFNERWSGTLAAQSFELQHGFGTQPNFGQERVMMGLRVEF